MAIIEAAMVSTPEGFTNSSTMAPNLYVYNKKPSAIKSLRKFIETLDVKHKTAVHRLVQLRQSESQQKRKCVVAKHCKAPWSYKKNQKVRENLYYWILHHPQVLQYQISKFCLNVYIDGNSKIKFKLLLQVSVQELHNSVVRPPY